MSALNDLGDGTTSGVGNGDGSSDSSANIEYTASSFDIHTFSATVWEMNVQFQVFKMDGSLLVWIGSGKEPSFEDLTLAMETRYDTLPLTTKLLGEGVDMVSSNLAVRLVKKLKKPVYVSFNLPMNRLMIPEIESRLFEEIATNQEKF